MHSGFGGEEIEERYGARGEIAHHNADDEQHGGTFHKHGEHKQSQKYQGSTEHGSKQNAHISAERGAEHRAYATAECEHHNGYAKTRTGGNTKNRRVGERVGENRLQQQSAHGECGSGECGGGNHGQPRLGDYHLPGIVVADFA